MPRPLLLVGSLLVGRNTEEAMILLVGDRLVGPPRYFALLVGSQVNAAVALAKWQGTG
jgi:hypothetical protein